MLGIHRRKAAKGMAAIARRKEAPAYIKPLTRFGLNIMSIGLLVGEDEVIDPARSPDAVGQLVVQTLERCYLGAARLFCSLICRHRAGQPQASLDSACATARCGYRDHAPGFEPA